MLEELHARDLALIEEVWLEFGPGMTVLSGETGAGKTVLVGALKLLLGERADSTAIRAGAAEALVEGRFVNEGTETVVRRRVSADGRSRCTLDGEMAAVGALAERVGPHVDLHGQHEHQALLSVPAHVGYLDRWAGEACERARAAYRGALREWQSAKEELVALGRLVDEAHRDVEDARFLVEEIDRVAPRAGEDDELEARLPALVHAERLAEAAAAAVELVRGDGGAQDRVAEAVSTLERVADIDPRLDGVRARLVESAALLEDAGAAIRAYRDSVEHDPCELDAVQARLSELAGLKRRYGPALDDVLRRRAEALTLLAAADSGEESLSQALLREAESRSLLEARARDLRLARTDAAPGFCEALAQAAAELAMEGARFEVAFEERPFESWTEDGSTRVEFLYASAPGQPARPLARIASGGELSRVMLAIKGALGSADRVETLVFDEVDAGIGGATALMVGERLARLARDHQVIVITHLAQVAAFADTHIVVRKVIEGDSAATIAVPAEGDDRVAEIARMLAGEVTEASLAHAAELLSSARAGSTPG